MTTATLIEKDGLRVAQVNGRRIYVKRITAITKIGKAQWYVVDRNEKTYHIEGGKQAGGSSRDWFLDSPEWQGKAIVCSSFCDAINLIENS
jgi:hypothetical protein